ncbi:MAG: fluoride efflux transporter CrcB [Proteobacteria bacterium]|nr:fluoride efflux transporter CrcB [Pseudomonadota bacterium]
MKNLLLVAAGGGLGAMGRYLLGTLVPVTTVPLGVLSANLIGAFVLGVLVGFGAQGQQMPEAVRLLVVVGVLGGFTTFSSFAMEAILLSERGMSLLGLLYVLISVIGALALMWLGMKLPRLIMGL